nr:3A [Enterovirus SEV-gx]
GPPTFTDLKIDIIETPPPPAIADLLQATDSEEIRAYCAGKGWICNVEPNEIRFERNLSKAMIVFQTLTTAVCVVGAIWVVYKLFAGFQ